LAHSSRGQTAGGLDRVRRAEAGCNLDTVRLAGNDLGVATGTLARLRVATNDLAIRVLRSRDADGG